MKIIYSLILFCLVGLSSHAQNAINLTLRYNLAQNRYEVYARPNFTQTNFLLGSAQITVVAPAASTPNQSFSVSAAAGGSWSDASPTYAPPAATSLDFHAVATSGQAINLVANQEQLLFSFTPPGGVCIPGFRLFVNGTDPSSNPVTMPGDYQNTIDGIASGASAEYYGANYANTGTLCFICNLVAPTLSK